MPPEQMSLEEILAAVKDRPVPDDDPLGDMCDDLLEVHTRLVRELLQQYGGNSNTHLIAAILMLVDRMPVALETSLDNIGLNLAELAEFVRSSQPPKPEN